MEYTQELWSDTWRGQWHRTARKPIHFLVQKKGNIYSNLITAMEVILSSCWIGHKTAAAHYKHNCLCRSEKWACRRHGGSGSVALRGVNTDFNSLNHCRVPSCTEKIRGWQWGFDLPCKLQWPVGEGTSALVLLVSEHFYGRKVISKKLEKLIREPLSANPVKVLGRLLWIFCGLQI